MEIVVDSPKKLRAGFLSPAFKITSENPAAEAHPQHWYLALYVLISLWDRAILDASEYIRFKIVFVF